MVIVTFGLPSERGAVESRGWVGHLAPRPAGVVLPGHGRRGLQIAGDRYS
jgi:hypothetical protein